MSYQEALFLVFIIFSILFTALTWEGVIFKDEHGGSNLMESIFLGTILAGWFVMICHFLVVITLEISK